MNGNLTLADNAKDSKGRHTEFVIIQNAILDKLITDSAVYACYCLLLRRADSEYSVTLQGVARDLCISIPTARKAFKKLTELGLLESEAEKNITGIERIRTSAGANVPNNCKRYTVYLLPKGAEKNAITAPLKESGQMLSPGSFIFNQDDFSEDEIREAEQGTMPKNVDNTPAPPPTKNTAPPVAPKPMQKHWTAAAEVARIEKINAIAVANGLFGDSGKNKLIAWLKRFAKEVGSAANDSEIAHMANLLSSNINEDLSRYIRRKAAAV